MTQVDPAAPPPAPPSPRGWSSAPRPGAGRIRWGRPFLIALAHVVAVAVSTTALPLIGTFTTSLGLSSIAFSLGYLYVLLWLGIGYMIAFAVATLPMLCWVVASEYWRVRSPFAHIAAGLAVGLCGWLITFGINVKGITAMGFDLALAGMLGGLIYWAIAGNSAGNWRRTDKA